MPDLVKPIHVELANKGGKVVMLEIFRQDDVSELVDVFYVKSFPIGCPANIVKTSLILFLESISTSRMLLNLSINRGIFWIPIFFLNFDILFWFYERIEKIIIYHAPLFKKNSNFNIISLLYFYVFFNIEIKFLTS